MHRGESFGAAPLAPVWQAFDAHAPPKRIVTGAARIRFRYPDPDLIRSTPLQ
jgi:hypothetical protein